MLYLSLANRFYHFLVLRGLYVILISCSISFIHDKPIDVYTYNDDDDDDDVDADDDDDDDDDNDDDDDDDGIGDDDDGNVDEDDDDDNDHDDVAYYISEIRSNTSSMKYTRVCVVQQQSRIRCRGPCHLYFT